MPPLWYWPILVLLLALCVVLVLDRPTIPGLDSRERVHFDFMHYGPLRRRGFSHKQACDELQRMWETR